MVKYIVFIVIVSLVAILISYLVIRNYKQKTKDTMKSIMSRLDNAISGNKSEVKYDESMESALGEKLNRYLEITEEQRIKTKEEKDAIKSLISDIAHQTKTPLSNIILLTQLVQEDDSLAESSRTKIDDVGTQAAKLQSLINILVKTSYLEGGLINVTPQLNPVSKLIEDTVSDISSIAKEKNIKIKSEIESDVQDYECKYDHKWTKESLINIIDNAIKYSQEDTTITISTEKLEMFVRVDIKDEGRGIDESELGQIFTRFYRSPEVSSIEGVGVGLYLAREIISMEGGYIKVSSSKGNGSVFSVYLHR